MIRLNAGSFVQHHFTSPLISLHHVHSPSIEHSDTSLRAATIAVTTQQWHQYRLERPSPSSHSLRIVDSTQPPHRPRTTRLPLPTHGDQHITLPIFRPPPPHKSRFPTSTSTTRIQNGTLNRPSSCWRGASSSTRLFMFMFTCWSRGQLDWKLNVSLNQRSLPP